MKIFKGQVSLQVYIPLLSTEIHTKAHVPLTLTVTFAKYGQTGRILIAIGLHAGQTGIIKALM